MKRHRRNIFNLLIAAVLITVITITGINPLQVYASDTLGGSHSSGNTSDTNKGDSTLNKATIYQIEYYTGGYVYIDVYEYSGASELLLLHQKGTAFNQYIGDYDSSATYLYIKNSAGVVTAPTVTYVTRYTFTPSTGAVSETIKGTTQILSSLAYYPKANTNKGYAWYIDGDYETLAYTPNKYDENGDRTTTIAPLDVATYYFNTGGMVVKGWRAFSFNINSRSVLNSFWGRTKSGTYALANASLSNDGIFSYEGLSLGYTSNNVWRGGVSIQFEYTRDGLTTKANLYYDYQLPLEGGQYEFNFADIEHIKLGGNDYTLTCVYITPVLQINWYDIQTGSFAITYSHDVLESAGCFEKGGDPVKLIGSVDKGDSSVGRPSGDPSLGGDFGSDSGVGDHISSPGDAEWDSSEHGFWENALHYLSNMASNIFNLGGFVMDKLGALYDLAVVFVEDLVNGFSASLMEALEYYFIPDMTEYNARVDALIERFDFIKEIQSAADSFLDLLKDPSERTAPKITIPLKSETLNMDTSVVIDFSWYTPYKAAFDVMIAGFIWLTFIYNLWRKLPDIIAGMGMDMVAAGTNIQRSAIESPAPIDTNNAGQLYDSLSLLPLTKNSDYTPNGFDEIGIWR